MVCVMSFSSLVMTFLVSTAAALPSTVSSQAGPKWKLTPLDQSEPPSTFLSLADLNKHDLSISYEPPPGWPAPHWKNITSRAVEEATDTNTLDKRATCLHDPSYVAGGAVWLKYSSDFCEMTFPTAGQNYSLARMWTTAMADLSDYPGWYKLAFGISRDSPTAVNLTQARCIAGYQRIVRHSVESWDCQGYTGHSLGDGQGAFGGGGTADEPEIPKYYMWVLRPTWPWEKTTP